ncbi:MAG: hypothetical protein V7642_2967 [Burkholderiales bacterium]|jgi:hypothetical protein
MLLRNISLWAMSMLRQLSRVHCRSYININCSGLDIDFVIGILADDLQ